MGLDGEQVLPRIINVACGLKGAAPLRRRVCEGLEGDVVEIGFGSGLNVPYYPEAVRRVAAVEPADVGWKLAEKRPGRRRRPVRGATRSQARRRAALRRTRPCPGRAGASLATSARASAEKGVRGLPPHQAGRPAADSRRLHDHRPRRVLPRGGPQGNGRRFPRGGDCSVGNGAIDFFLSAASGLVLESATRGLPSTISLPAQLLPALLLPTVAGQAGQRVGSWPWFLGASPRSSDWRSCLVAWP